MGRKPSLPLGTPSDQSKAYTVTQITRLIKERIETSFQAIWIEGEISNLSKHSSGHMYFTLKDADAQLQVVMFRSFNQKVTFDVTDGMKVLIFGSLSVYPKRGSYQLYAERIEPKGVGALQLAFERLKVTLKNEGLFDEEHKKPLPRFVQRIGVVTSPTGAAIRDILNVIHRRFEHVEVILNPVRVQGETARDEIARAIDEFNEHGLCDVLIVGRGGGSLEDLWAFNEECVARAIYRSAIPIISAVGHEIDFTISDFAADFRAPTPSAAAEVVVMRKDEWTDAIEALTADLKRAMRDLIEQYRQRIEQLRSSYAFKQPRDIIRNYMQRVDETTRQLHNYVRSIISIAHSRYKQHIAALEALSPLGILTRGYSISYALDEKGKQRDVVRSIKDIHKGALIKTRLAGGAFISEVRNIEDEERERGPYGRNHI